MNNKSTKFDPEDEAMLNPLEDILPIEELCEACDNLFDGDTVKHNATHQDIEVPVEPIYEAVNATDNIRPDYYDSHPSGVECIDIVGHMNFNLGNAIKYIWRAGLKNPAEMEIELEKAITYLQFELNRITGKRMG